MTDKALYERIALLEAQVKFLAGRLDVDLPDFASLAQAEVSETVRSLVASGDKMGAVKAYRRETGVDLAAALKVIESI